MLIQRELSVRPKFIIAEERKNQHYNDESNFLEKTTSTLFNLRINLNSIVHLLTIQFVSELCNVAK